VLTWADHGSTWRRRLREVRTRVRPRQVVAGDLRRTDPIDGGAATFPIEALFFRRRGLDLPGVAEIESPEQRGIKSSMNLLEDPCDNAKAELSLLKTQ
jgi:hypothetical protein